jgi:hypothetical protein
LDRSLWCLCGLLRWILIVIMISWVYFVCLNVRQVICEFPFIEISRYSITNQKVKVEYGTTDIV